MNKKMNKEKVVLGLKFIAENQSASNQEVQSYLREIGWNFSWGDFYLRFPWARLFRMKVFKGMRKGRIWAGANILMNLSDNPSMRQYISDLCLSEDDEISIYHFIRKVTKDGSYTKDSLSN